MWFFCNEEWCDEEDEAEIKMLNLHYFDASVRQIQREFGMDDHGTYVSHRITGNGRVKDKWEN